MKVSHNMFVLHCFLCFFPQKMNRCIDCIDCIDSMQSMVGCWCFNLSRKHWLIQADLINLHHLPLKRRKKRLPSIIGFQLREAHPIFLAKKTSPLVHHVCHKISIPGWRLESRTLASWICLVGDFCYFP